MSPIAVGGLLAGVGVAPTLVLPTDSTYEDFATVPTFEWNYNGDLTQTFWGLRRKSSGSSTYRYWNGTAGLWQSSPYYRNLSSLATGVGILWSYTFPSGAWKNGLTYAWSVATTDANGITLWSADYSVTGQGAPTLTGIAVTANTAYPKISWTSTTAHGTAQQGYQVIIYSAAQYGAGGFAPGVGPNTWDSTPLAGQDQSTIVTQDAPIFPGTYRAYVQIAEDGGELSAWAYIGFTPSYSPPAAPTITAAPSDSANPSLLESYVTLTLTDHNGSIAAWTNLQFIVEFSDDSGTTWWTLDDTPVSITAAGQVSTVTDRLGTPGFTRMYHCQVQGTAGGGIAASARPVASQAHPNPYNWWLKNPKLHTDNMRISLLDAPFERKSTDRINALSPVGRPDPVILSDVPSLPILSATIQFLTNDDAQAFELLRSKRTTLLLQGPYPMGQWYIRFGPDTGVSTNLRSVRTSTATGIDAVDSTVTVTMYVVAKP